MNRKAQTTIFIILGIVVLAAIFIITTVVRYTAEKEIGPEIETTEKIPVELNPFKTAVDACIEKLSAEGSKKLMMYGGYMSQDLFTKSPFPTEANSVEFFPDSNYYVPYWYYLGGPNECSTSGECQFSTMMPALCAFGRDCRGYEAETDGQISFESQLSDYINKNLKTCLNDFKDLEKQGFEVTELGPVQTTYYIKDRKSENEQGSVYVYVKYPLEVKIGDTKTKITEFGVQHESNLYELYEIAAEITSHKCMLENQLLDKLSKMGSKDSALPPFLYDEVGTQGRKIWIKSEVEDELNQLTSLVIPQIMIDNSLMLYPAYFCKEGDKLCELYESDAIGNVFKPLSEEHDAIITFSYKPEWEPYFNIEPSQGEVLGPTITDMGDGVFKAFLYKLLPRTYEFYYQYSFPTIIEIEMENKKERNDIFRFALESNIRSNKCFGEGMTVVRQKTEKNLFCEVNEETEEDEITVLSATDEKPVKDARVIYYNGANCLLGYTNEEGKLTVKYPLTPGAQLIFSHNGYLAKYVYDDDLDGDFQSHLTVKMEPYVEKNIKLKIIDYSSISTINSAGVSGGFVAMNEKRHSLAEEPKDTDLITITLTKLPENENDISKQYTLVYEKGELFPESVELAPGTYQADILLITMNPVTLPEEHNIYCLSDPTSLKNCIKTPKQECMDDSDFPDKCRDSDCYSPDNSECDKWCYENTNCYKWGWTCEGNTLGKDCQGGEDGAPMDFEEKTLEAINNGGALLTEATHTFTLTRSKLDQEGDLTLYLFRQKIPTRWYNLQELNVYRNWSKDYWVQLIPEVK